MRVAPGRPGSLLFPAFVDGRTSRHTEDPSVIIGWVTTELPIACSLGADDLSARLRLIAEIGAGHLIGREVEGRTQVLRFRRGDGVRQSLEGVVAAEEKCCPFLEMEIHERDAELILTIGVAAEGAEIAAGLADVFAAA